MIFIELKALQLWANWHFAVPRVKDWCCVGYGLAKLSFWQSMEKIEALASGRGHLLMVKHIPHTPPKLMVVEASANSPGVSAL